MENFKSQGRPTLSGSGASENFALINSLEDHKGSVIRLKVTAQEWIALWRLWDRAVDITKPVDAVNDYNQFAKSLVEKYGVHLEPNQTVEFT